MQAPPSQRATHVEPAHAVAAPLAPAEACDHAAEVTGEHSDPRSIAGAVLLSLVHVPCCGLPMLTLLFGVSGAAAPWASRWAAWAAWTWPVAAVVLAWSWWRLAGAHTCPTVQRQRRILIAATAILVGSLVLGHVTLPWLGVAHAH